MNERVNGGGCIPREERKLDVRCRDRNCIECGRSACSMATKLIIVL